MSNKGLGRKEGVSRDEDQAREGEGFGIKDLLGLSLEMFEETMEVPLFHQDRTKVEQDRRI